MIFICIGAVFGALAVVLGAVAAHLLADALVGRSGELFTLANQFHFYHALALIAVGAVSISYSQILLRLSAWLMVLGTVIFSGSLYALALTGIPLWGSMTPFGGSILILAWLMLAASAIRLRTHR